MRCGAIRPDAGLDVINRSTDRGHAGHEDHLAAGDLRRNVLSVRSSYAHGLGRAVRKVDAGFHNIFASDIERVEDNQGHALGLGVQCRGNALDGVVQHARKLIHCDHVVVPGELVRLGRCGSSRKVVEMRAHRQRPGAVQPLQRIGPRTQPFGANRRLLRRVGQQFLLPNPTLLVRLRGQRAGGVIRQLHLTGITRERGGLRGLDIQEHLIGGGGNHADRPLAHLHRGPLGMRLAEI